MAKNIKVSQINDFFIRCLLGQEGHEHLLLNFVNAFMLDSGYEAFTEVSIINPYNFKTNKDDHQTIVDVKAKTIDNEFVIIEIQVERDKLFADRALYYWAKNYITLEEKRIKYHLLKPIICINVLAFELDEEFDVLHTTYDIRCKETGRLLTDKFLMHFLELPKLADELKNKDLLGWYKYLTSNNLEDDIMSITKENPVLESAVKYYKEFSLNKDLIDEYTKREIFLRQQSDLLEQRHKEGREEGERNRNIEIAVNMLAKNMAFEVISEITGLSAADIENIKNNL